MESRFGEQSDGYTPIDIHWENLFGRRWKIFWSLQNSFEKIRPKSMQKAITITQSKLNSSSTAISSGWSNTTRAPMRVLGKELVPDGFGICNDVELRFMRSFIWQVDPICVVNANYSRLNSSENVRCCCLARHQVDFSSKWWGSKWRPKDFQRQMPRWDGLIPFRLNFYCGSVTQFVHPVSQKIRSITVLAERQVKPQSAITALPFQTQWNHVTEIWRCFRCQCLILRQRQQTHNRVKLVHCWSPCHSCHR